MLKSNGTGGISSFREKAFSGVDDRLADIAVPGNAIPIYSSSPPFVRNVACWTVGVLGMTALCADQRATLISPDIVICVTHVIPVNGTTCTFVTDDGNNTNITRTISAALSLGPPLSGAGGDITLCKLSSALPGTIHPVRLAVSNLLNYLPPNFGTANWNIPMLQSTGEPWVTVNNLDGVYTGEAGLTNIMLTSVPTATPRSNFWVAKGSDDSGRACGVIIDDEFIMLMTLSRSVSGGTGWANWLYLAAIDAAIVTLGGQPRASTFSPQ